LSRRLGAALGVALAAGDGGGEDDGEGTTNGEGETSAARQAAATEATAARPTAPRKRRRVIGPNAVDRSRQVSNPPEAVMVGGPASALLIRCKTMAPLPSTKRSQLPDRAFAYIDATGRRRLPINDAAHVRNALARFNQVVFEDEAAQERARTKLLKAARKHGILPIGFITGQLSSRGAGRLPSGFVTFLLADIEGSTALVRQLGDGYAPFLADLRRFLRATVQRSGGMQVDAHADEFFAVFKHAPAGLAAALGIQRGLRDRAWPEGAQVRVRIGLHSGRPTLTNAGYVGLAVHAVARISSAGHGGQIILSHAALRSMDGPRPSEINFVDLGSHRLRGLPEVETLFQVSVPDLRAEFPPLRSGPGRPGSL
jgi:class 3 adenylate cyclase